MKMTETLEYYTPFFLLNENHINPVCRPFNSTITVLPTEDKRHLSHYNFLFKLKI